MTYFLRNSSALIWNTSWPDCGNFVDCSDLFQSLPWLAAAVCQLPISAWWFSRCLSIVECCWLKVATNVSWWLRVHSLRCAPTFGWVSMNVRWTSPCNVKTNSYILLLSPHFGAPLLALAMDRSIHVSMKTAASCDIYYELQTLRVVNCWTHSAGGFSPRYVWFRVVSYCSTSTAACRRAS